MLSFFTSISFLLNPRKFELFININISQIIIIDVSILWDVLRFMAYILRFSLLSFGKNIHLFYIFHLYNKKLVYNFKSSKINIHIDHMFSFTE